MGELTYCFQATTPDSESHFLYASDDFEMLCKDEFYLHIIGYCEIADQMNIFVETTETFMQEHLASTGHSINYELGINRIFYSTLTFIWVHCFINNIIHSQSFGSIFIAW